VRETAFGDLMIDSDILASRLDGRPQPIVAILRLVAFKVEHGVTPKASAEDQPAGHATGGSLPICGGRACGPPRGDEGIQSR
jgi:hypothetical protein